MDTDVVLSRICQLPHEFRRRGDVSMLDLVRDSGYLNNRDVISEPHLEQYFRMHRDAIDAWVLESMDNRGTPAWYLVAPSNVEDRWTVGYVGENGPADRELLFSDGAKACASF